MDDDNYTCHMCGAKLEGQEELDAHNQENHPEEI